jgi:hypothetical protein
MPLDHNKTATVLFEFKTADGRAPDAAAFKRDFGFGDHEVDDAYGFIPMQGSFLTVVAQDAAERVAAEKHPHLVGYFSNGGIVPFQGSRVDDHAALAQGNKTAPAPRKPDGFGPCGPM